MRLGVHALGLKPNRTGVEELYLRHVLAALKKLDVLEDLVVFTDAGNHESFADDNPVIIGPGSPSGHKTIEQALKAADLDVILAPLSNAPNASSIPQVLYTMDLPADGAPRRGWFGGSTPHALRKAAHSAAAVIVPSKFVQQECLRMLDLAIDRVVIAPLGTDNVQGKAADCIAETPFLITQGDGPEIDDLSHIVEAMDRLPEMEHHSLLVVGHPTDDRQDWGPRVMRFERLPMGHLLALYQNSDAFVYASRRAGSPVRVLNAMRAGACAVAPRIGGLPEAAGTAPFYFDPVGKTSLVSVLQRALRESPSERATRIKFGRQAASAYTWENCATRTLSALRRA